MKNFCRILLSIFFVFYTDINLFGKTEKLKGAEYKLVLSVDDFPISFDPLDSDLTNNTDMMKLRYFTPIEIDHEDKFKSSVLKSFEYDNKSFKISWVFRKDLKYSDGSPILPVDLVTSIKRMALKRKDFPVLNSVIGIEEWALQPNPLLQDIPGIKLKDDMITISFNRNVNNPFFQFTLALFSIQPSRCFDLKTSKLICEIPPASGYYDFLGKAPKLDPKDEKHPSIAFMLRNGFELSGSFKMPSKIILEYSSKDLPEIIKDMDDFSVARTDDSRITDEFINKFRTTVNIKRLPKTAIWYLLLNPNFESFKDKTCRRIFANKYRQLYGARVSSVKIATKSFSSPIMPGYLTNEQLDEKFPTKESKNCNDIFKKYPVKYKKSFPFWDKMLADTMTAVGMPTTGFYDGENSISSIFDSFVSNESSVLTAYVSFWPLDLSSGFNPTLFIRPKSSHDLGLNV